MWLKVTEVRLGFLGPVAPRIFAKIRRFQVPDEGDQC